MPSVMTMGEATEAGLWHEPAERLALINSRGRIREAYDTFVSQQKYEPNPRRRIMDGSMVADSWDFQQQLRDLNPLFEELEQTEEIYLLWEKSNSHYWDDREDIEREPEEWPMSKWIDSDPDNAREEVKDEISFVERRLKAYTTKQEPLKELLRLRKIAKEDTHDIEEQLNSIETKKEALKELLPLLQAAKDRLAQIEQTANTTKDENAPISIKKAQEMATAVVKRYHEAQRQVKFHRGFFAESFDSFVEEISCCDDIDLPSIFLNGARVVERPILKWRLLAVAELLKELVTWEEIEKRLLGVDEDDSDGDETVTGLNGDDHEFTPGASRGPSPSETPDHAKEAHNIITERLAWIEMKLKSIPESQKALEEVLDHLKAAKDETSTFNGSIDGDETVKAEETEDVKKLFIQCFEDFVHRLGLLEGVHSMRALATPGYLGGYVLHWGELREQLLHVADRLQDTRNDQDIWECNWYEDAEEEFCACGEAGWKEVLDGMTIEQAVTVGGVENAKVVDAEIEDELQEIAEQLLEVKGRRDALFSALGSLAAEGGVGEWERLGLYDVHGKFVDGRFVNGKWVAWSEPKEVPSARVEMATSPDGELMVNIVPGEESIDPTQVARDHVKKQLKQIKAVRKQTVEKLKTIETEENAMIVFLERLKATETSDEESKDAVEIDDNADLKEQLLEAEAEEVVLKKVIDGLEAAKDDIEEFEEMKYALEQQLENFQTLIDETLKQLVENAEAEDKFDGGKATYDVEQTLKEIEGLTEDLAQELSEAAKEETERLIQIERSDKLVAAAVKKVVDSVDDFKEEVLRQLAKAEKEIVVDVTDEVKDGEKSNAVEYNTNLEVMHDGDESDTVKAFKGTEEIKAAEDTKESETTSEHIVDNATVA